jgi:L-2-hydroxyglutarate oxidase LhgO
MEKIEILIIGAGVIGLAVAERLSRKSKDIAILERHESFGKDASSRNSEVIHAGIYYPTNTLQAKLCVKGRQMLYEFLEHENVPFKKIGKLIIANDDQEQKKIDQLYKLALDNQVENISKLSKKEISEYEPNIVAQEALFSPETGILDSHKLMKRLEAKAQNNGVMLAYGCEVLAITRCNGTFVITAKDTDGEDLEIGADIVINCAGCSSGKIADMAGIAPDDSGYTVYPCKGEYFKLSPRHRNKLSHLVYPAPTKISLGIHTVLDLNNGLKLGPNAYYVEDASDYRVKEESRQEFFESAKTYLPFIAEHDLTPDMAGIRPKIQPPEDSSFKDFIIQEEHARGLPGFINLIGIESPGLTSCLAIAEYVESLL